MGGFSFFVLTVREPLCVLSSHGEEERERKVWDWHPPPSDEGKGCWDLPYVAFLFANRAAFCCPGELQRGREMHVSFLPQQTRQKSGGKWSGTLSFIPCPLLFPLSFMNIPWTNLGTTWPLYCLKPPIFLHLVFLFLWIQEMEGVFQNPWFILQSREQTSC